MLEVTGRGVGTEVGNLLGDKVTATPVYEEELRPRPEFSGIGDHQVADVAPEQGFRQFHDLSGLLVAGVKILVRLDDVEILGLVPWKEGRRGSAGSRIQMERAAAS